MLVQIEIYRNISSSSDNYFIVAWHDGRWMLTRAQRTNSRLAFTRVIAFTLLILKRAGEQTRGTAAGKRHANHFGVVYKIINDFNYRGNGTFVVSARGQMRLRHNTPFPQREENRGGERTFTWMRAPTAAIRPRAHVYGCFIFSDTPKLYA